VLDFSGLATLYGGHYASASTERELIRALDTLSHSDQRITLLELKLDPALKPVTASRHF
jgi:2-succinyl-5-enolpyruvyl-6-hydroxy-3-cyclohexene-1-carboxylate synthase